MVYFDLFINMSSLNGQFWLNSYNDNCVLYGILIVFKEKIYLDFFHVIISAGSFKSIQLK